MNVTAVPGVDGDSGAPEAVRAVQAPKVKRSRGVPAVVPPAVVTVTSTVPAAWAGLTAVSVESLTTLKLEAAVPPKLTLVVPLLNPFPVTVTVVPPLVGPALGEAPVTTSAGRSEDPTVNDHV